MKKHHALIVFILIIPILTELVTSSTPFPKIFSPVVFIFLLIFYSVPVLIMREIALRNKLGLLGLFVLGLAYGVINEGVVARTLFLTGENMFIESFRQYDHFGINFPWVFFIIPWHALCSVIYPVMLVHAMYPEEKERSWLSIRQMWIWGLIVVVLGSVTFFNTDKYMGIPAGYLVLAWASVVLLVLLALKCKQRIWMYEVGDVKYIRGPIMLGGVSSLWLVLTMILAGVGAPWYVHLIYQIVFFSGIYALLKRKRWINIRDLAHFAIGHYSGGAVITILISMGDALVVVGELIVFALLWALYKKIAKSGTGPITFDKDVIVS